MKRISFLLLAILLTSSTIYSQRWKLKRYEAVVGIGTTNLFTDLGGKIDASLLFIEDITFRDTRPSIYTAARFKINPQYSAKLAIIYGYGKTEDFEGSRNEHRQFLSKTHLVEISGNFEYYFIQETRRWRSAAMYNRRGMLNNYSTISAYVFGGIGLAKYWNDLQIEPRATDIYDDKNKIIPSFPLGLGLKYVISDKWMIGYEIGGRYTFCDYIDGVKTPDSKHNDIYWISALNLNYRIKTSRRGLPLFLDRYRVRIRTRRR
jgi:OOP family OmpA-OmpF porin